MSYHSQHYAYRLQNPFNVSPFISLPFGKTFDPKNEEFKLILLKLPVNKG